MTKHLRYLNYVDALVNKSAILDELKDDQEVITLYDKALEEHPVHI